MGFIDTTRLKTGFTPKNSSADILDDIGRKLPKKLRKKLRWKKITPILSLLIAVLAPLVSILFSQREPKTATTPAKPTSAGRQPGPSTRFSDEFLQSYVERAEAYQAEIDRLAQTATGAASQERVRELAAHVQTWTGSIISLAQRIENFRQNKLINNDLKEVPKSIASLEARLNSETEPAMRGELERTLANRRQQLAALEKVRRSIQMAEVKIESTISLLGTIYSQILAGQSTRQVADYRRLLNEVDEEVHTLQDHLEALEEVKTSRL